jgi:hypothetical protein
MKKEKKEFDWFDRPRVRRGLWVALFVTCTLTLVAELFVWPRKGHFGLDGVFGFYAVLGFVSCALMIVVAKGLGMWLKRPEDYYGADDEADLKPEDIDESA